MDTKDLAKVTLPAPPESRFRQELENPALHAIDAYCLRI